MHQLEVRLQKLDPQRAKVVSHCLPRDRGLVGGVSINRKHVQEFHRCCGNRYQASRFRDNTNSSGCVSNERFRIRMVPSYRRQTVSAGHVLEDWLVGLVKTGNTSKNAKDLAHTGSNRCVSVAKRIRADALEMTVLGCAR